MPAWRHARIESELTATHGSQITSGDGGRDGPMHDMPTESGLEIIQRLPVSVIIAILEIVPQIAYNNRIQSFYFSYLRIQIH